MRVTSWVVLCFVLIASQHPASAQQVAGTPPFGTFGGGHFDVINLANLNVHFSVPVITKAGRGMPFVFALNYDSSIWKPQDVNEVTTWRPASGWGWQGEIVAGSLIYERFVGGACLGNTQYRGYTDPSGTFHPIPVTVTSCSGPTTKTATDGSGFVLVADYVPENSTVYSPAGLIFKPPISLGSTGSVTDSNGNRISIQTGSTNTYTDTLGATVLTSSIPANFVRAYTYTAPSGANASVTVNYTSFSVQTNFGAPGVTEYGPTNATLVTSIVLPDSTSYQFTYEPTPGFPGKVTGRIASVTLPTGGTISYQYIGGFNGIAADGTTAGFNRTVNDGTNTSTRGMWISGPGITHDVDVQTNQETVYNFSGMYQTQMHVYDLREPPATPTGTLLRSSQTCYNDSCSGTVTTPITKTDVYFNIGDRTLRTLTTFDPNGLPTQIQEWDFQTQNFSGPPLRKTFFTYAVLGNNIVDRPSSIVIKDGNDNIKAQTTFVYDEGGVTGTSGTPQHVAITGSRGNATTVNSWVGGSVWLTKHSSYFDTGTPNTATDVNGAVTSFVYGTGSCGNSFVTTVNMPLTLIRSFTYNCTGGVQTSVTDENGKTTTTAFSDAFFWRPASITDPLNNVTNIGYSGARITEANMIFNGGNSLTDRAVTLDQLGRVRTVQRRQGLTPPALNLFDSVQTDYDHRGRPSRVTIPYVGAGTQLNPSAPATTTTYDVLDRPTLITDPSGGTVSFSYVLNDVLITVGPAPTGENTKRKQYEYDALGRLTSVCEITSGPGSGNCAQTNSQTGYWTKYQYDTLGNLTQVTQNAQSGSPQTRTFASDGLGRITSETNPETGQVTYIYDTGTSPCGASAGNLTERQNAAGTRTCFFYDALNRLTDKGDFSGGTWTNCQRYRFDSATVNGVVMTNSKGRMAEAYTDNCVWPTQVKLTDIGFNYNARGEVVDTYQSTPNSQGYYHLAATYHPHGLLKTLSGLPQMSTITYDGLDGEGRITTVTDEWGQNLVTGVSYNNSSTSQPVGALTAVNIGNGDSDNFNFDPNTGRLLQHQFNVNTQSQVGALTWNTNGSLKQLTITDAFNSSNAQTCSYAHDDLQRISSVNCGTGKWNQTFSYDTFGNISKTASGTGTSFQPTYSGTTNRITALPGFTPTYDLNGNLTNDSFHTYQWNADGRPTQIDSVSLTYDALGRMVEQNRNGSFTQILYAPDGTKIATAGSGWLQTAFVRLPGGVTAVYKIEPQSFPPTGVLKYYRHSDWLGSSRLGSNQDRTFRFSTAYAPFGEDYAGSGTTDLSFTGQNQDTVIGLYDFMFREYSPVQGRWISPDPAGLKAASLTNPRTWNRYAYIGNSPLDGVDPLGLLRGKPGTEFWFPPMPSFSCNMDGLMTPCGMVSHMLRSGAAVQCPGNICNRVGPNGVVQQFRATMRGGAYYSVYGPGSFYYSAEAAGKAAVSYYEAATATPCTPDGKRCERGGYLTRDDNELFSFSEGGRGSPCGANENCFGITRYGAETIPNLVGFYHTHPWERSVAQFGWDVITSPSNPNFIPDYVGTPGGGIFRIDPIAAVLRMGDSSRPYPVCQLAGPALAGVSACR